MPWLYPSLHTKTRQSANWGLCPLPVGHCSNRTSGWSYWLFAFLQESGLSDFNDRWLDRTSCYWFNFLQVKAALQYVIKVSAAACVLCTNHIDTRPKRVLGSNSVCTFSFCRYLQEAAEAKQLEQCSPRVRWPQSAMVLISHLPSSLICWGINEDPSCAEIWVSAEGLCWMGVYVSCS